MRTGLLRRIVAEAAGTSLLVGIGTTSIVWGAVSGGAASWELAVAWFIAVLLPNGLFIGVSGAHLNPAVTLALAVSRRVAWREVPGYLVGQGAGAFLASAVVLVTFGDVAHLGATVPVANELALAFLAELGFTALLVASVFTLSDRGEGRLRWRLVLPPAVVGVSTYVIGPITGSSLNPARTLAPAVLSGTYTALWLYLIAVPLGAVCVALLWRPTAVDRLDRGPGRVLADR